MVNIERLDRLGVLLALFNRARIKPGFLRHFPSADARSLLQRILDGQAKYVDDLAQRFEAETGFASTPVLRWGWEYNASYVDYVQGRAMMVRIPPGAKEFDELGYDMDNGPGAAQGAVDGMRLRKEAQVG